MSGLRYKPGDSSNPYDPAALTGDPVLDDLAANQRMASDPAKLRHIQNMQGNPEMMHRMLEMVKADAAEARARGETPLEMMMREKAEWAKADALSVKVKERVSSNCYRG